MTPKTSNIRIDFCFLFPVLRHIRLVPLTDALGALAPRVGTNVI